jgi:hypothetical protein
VEQLSHEGKSAGLASDLLVGAILVRVDFLNLFWNFLEILSIYEL